MCLSPSMPETASSTYFVTSFSMSSGDAPTHWVMTVT